ncbi:MAG TPA: diacylglycerol kinase family protein [Patescibacteria group bacterium]
MYCYLYDTFLKDKKFLKTKLKIENRLTDLDLKGRSYQLTILNNAREIAREAARQGAKTLVVIGDDKLTTKVIDVIAHYDDIALGIIPVGGDLKISKSFDIPAGLAACDTLSGRIVKNISLGKINDFYFLDQISMPLQNTTVNFDEKYNIQTLNQNQSLEISNLNQRLAENNQRLEAIILETKDKKFFNFFGQKSQSSIFNIKRAAINGPSIPIKIDNQKVIKSPALIEVVPNKLRVIVGKKLNNQGTGQLKNGRTEQLGDGAT